MEDGSVWVKFVGIDWGEGFVGSHRQEARGTVWYLLAPFWNRQKILFTARCILVQHLFLCVNWIHFTFGKLLWNQPSHHHTFLTTKWVAKVTVLCFTNTFLALSCTHFLHTLIVLVHDEGDIQVLKHTGIPSDIPLWPGTVLYFFKWSCLIALFGCIIFYSHRKKKKNILMKISVGSNVILFTTWCVCRFAVNQKLGTSNFPPRLIKLFSSFVTCIYFKKVWYWKSWFFIES